MSTAAAVAEKATTARDASVRERPILFSAPMVRAILDGTKTQTRRVVLPQPTGEARSLAEWSRRVAATCGEHSPDPEKSAVHVERLRGRVFPFANAEGRLSSPVCPFGHPGDRLWVRETWAAEFLWPEHGGGRMRQWAQMPPANRVPGEDAFVAYRADGAIHGCDNSGVDDGACSDGAEQNARWAWKPSIHMPRWASRITLELTGVRVERVQDISEADAIAEGCFDEKEHDGSLPSHIYRQLWDSLNAARGYGWDANPFVWVLEFRRVDT